MDYALQNPFKEELEQLQQQGIITPLVMDETAEWFYTYTCIKGKWLVQTMGWTSNITSSTNMTCPQGTSVNDILTKLTNAKYIWLI